MQTDHDHTPSPRHEFDPHSAQTASLHATISRVRFHRRVRRTTVAALVAGACLLAGKFIIPSRSPALRTGPGPAPEIVKETSPLRVRTMPLSAEQKIVSVSSPGLKFRTPADSMIALRINTPPDAKVARLGEHEFRAWLAENRLCLIQMAGGAPEVRPLRE